jgi:hypothetical protein
MLRWLAASAVDIEVLEIIAHCGRMQQEANTMNLKGLKIVVEAAETEEFDYAADTQRIYSYERPQNG